MWVQLGRHADGKKNLFKVALREKGEESYDIAWIPI